jgi:hypothetical protein
MSYTTTDSSVVPSPRRKYNMMLAQSSRTASAATATRRAISSRQGRPAVLRIRAEVSTSLLPFTSAFSQAFMDSVGMHG